jgi:hypothetical protein
MGSRGGVVNETRLLKSSPRYVAGRRRRMWETSTEFN